jgi:hypothetical protein
LVPVKSGAIPAAPEGGQSTQDGTLLGRAEVLGAEEPLDLDCADDALAAVVDPAEAPPTPEPTPTETAADELLEPAPPFDGVVVPGNVTAPYGFVRPMPAVPEVWAAADWPSRTKKQ